MNRREFVTAAGAAAVVGGVAVPGAARAESLATSGGGDDSDALEDALLDAAEGDGVVILGSGIFRLTRTIDIPDGVVIIGQGRLATAVKWQSSYTPTSGQPLLRVVDGAEVGLADLSLASAHSNAHTGECGLEIESGHVDIDDCLFLDVTGANVIAHIDEPLTIHVS
jgi:hypothetical protein